MVKREKYIAVYVRVSSNKQELRSQVPDLEKWAETQELPVKFFRDKASGKTMQRTGWQRLSAALGRREIETLCCWRIDRLGRTASGLTALFDELQKLGVNFVSLRDGVDLSTPAGRMLANVLASVAQFETEVRAERVNAGIAAAKAAGKRWGGSKPGVRKVVTPAQERAIVALKEGGETITAIAKAVSLSRVTVYDVLRKAA